MSETKPEITEKTSVTAEAQPALTDAAGSAPEPEKASPEKAAAKPKKPRTRKKAADPEKEAAPKKKKSAASEKKTEKKSSEAEKPVKSAVTEKDAVLEKEEKTEKKGESTKTFNDLDIADLAKLTAVNSRGDHMQFSLGMETEIRYGEKADIVKGVLTLDCSYFGIPQFKIALEGRRWMFYNCNLKTTTFISGRKVENQEPVMLEDGNLIRVSSGNRSQIFVFEDSYDPQVEWKSILLNRSKPLTIFSSEAMKEMTNANVERKAHKDYPHAIFVYAGGKWQVKDVNIGKGITVNGERIKNSRELSLYDVIRIGSTIYVYLPGRLVYNLTMGTRKNLIIDIADRTVRTSLLNKKVLLKDISLTIEPGNLVLLLGGSGAGKTTFINAVTGYETANAKILNGGVDVYENYDQMKYEIGVVPQQDLLRGTDSVYMTLYNAAELRIPMAYTIREIRSRVNEVLETFGLAPYKHSLVKDLSGGQRKRLSIACEYIGDPSLFILDEPDSGLDGVIARELMERLRRIADDGKIVIVITHTPDRVIDLFDQIIVLAKDKNKTGRLAFFGSIEEARKFFGKEKMEDIVKCVNTPEEGGEGRADELIEAYDELRKRKDADHA